MDNLSKAQAIKIVTDCAKDYRENLVNREFMFVVTDKHKRISYFEVSFDASNFLHLTGCKVNDKELSPLKFYERCLDRKLSENDFEFSDDGTTFMKLAVLPTMMRKSLSANSIGDYNHRQPMLYTEKLAGGIKGCMGFVKDKASERYVPNTVLQVDIRTYTNETYRIIATYRKFKTDDDYSEIVYVAKKVDWSKIDYPDAIAGLPKPDMKWKDGFGSKYIKFGEKYTVKCTDEIIILSKGVQKYFMDTYGREIVYIPNGVNRPVIREPDEIKKRWNLEKDSNKPA